MYDDKTVVLGANGVVGTSLLEDLSKKGFTNIFATSRSFKDNKVKNITYCKSDLLNKDDVEIVLENAKLAYLTVGLPYNIKIWKEQWPIIIDNVIHACIKNNTKLVFFDTVYSYGKVDGVMTEESPLNAVSEKGKLRIFMENKIKNSAKDGLKYVIAKSADFYGPFTTNSLMYVACLENILKNKKPYWLGSLDKLHSYTYVPDAIKAMVTLGIDPRADNQVWHLPTKSPALTGREYIGLMNKILERKKSPMAVNKFMLKILSLFDPLVKELPEVFYQNDSDYVFSSAKYDSAFGDVKTTEYEEGLKKMIESFVKK
jgi:nucleoside-diphosphate-sugar epimerase